MIKLYGSRMTAANRCHVLLREIGLKYEEMPIDLTKGEQKTEAYLKLNPNGKVPCLVDGDFIIWESMAVNRYLAGKYKPELLGKSPEDAARIDQWSYWAILNVMPPLIHLFMKKDDDAFKQAKESLPVLHRILDNHLADHRYLLGEFFSLADINVGTVIAINLRTDNDLTPYPHLNRWLQELVQRPAFQR